MSVELNRWRKNFQAQFDGVVLGQPVLRLLSGVSFLVRYSLGKAWEPAYHGILADLRLSAEYKGGTEPPAKSQQVHFHQPSRDLVPSRNRLGYQVSRVITCCFLHLLLAPRTARNTSYQFVWHSSGKEGAQFEAQGNGVNPSVETVWNWHTYSSVVFPSQLSSSLSR